MGSPPTSSLRFLTPKGEELPGPPEWKPCLVELPVPADQAQATSFSRNGAPLRVTPQRLGDRIAVVALWTGTSTGSFELELSCPAVALHEQSVASVQPSKLTPEAFSRMLYDLELRLPAAIAIGLSRLGGLSGIEVLPARPSTLAQELLRVRRAVRGRRGRAGLRMALDEVAGDPHRNLLPRRAWTARDHARRIDGARLHQALARGDVDASGLPVQVPETYVEPSTDNYENRILRAFHDQLDRHIRLLRKAVPKHSPKVVMELDDLGRELARGRGNANFLDAVGELAHAPDRVTMVLLERPPYRAAFEGFLEFRRSSAARLDDPALEAPLEHLHHLYQTWGVLNVVDVTLEHARAAGYLHHANHMVVRHASGLYVELLRNGRPAVELRHPDGSSLRIIPQRSYRDSGPLISSSHPQIPDISIEISHPGIGTRAILFDPKYKLAGDGAEGGAGDGRPLKADVDAMHAYRDAVVDDGGKRAVSFAAILYPGFDVSYGSGLAALRAQPLEPRPLRAAIGRVVRRCIFDHAVEVAATRAPPVAVP